MSLPDYMVAHRSVRPIGISLLSVLHFIGGLGLVILVVVFIAMFRNDPRIVEGFARVGIPIPLLAAGIFLLAGLGIASAIGMWKGAKWGWYLGSFYYAYAIVRNVSAIFSVSDIVGQMPAEELATSSRGAEHYYMKFGIRALISALLYLYFFKSNVRDFFGMTEAKKWKAILAHFVICLVVFVGFSVAIAVSN